MSDPRLPTAIIGGAQRSGTTALFNMLANHPDVFVPHLKEPHYFAFAGSKPRFTGPGDDRFVAELVHHRREDYLALFERGTRSQHRLEASALYLMYPGTAECIAREVPDVRLVFILRDPAERAYSGYLFMRREDREPLGFIEALAAEAERIAAGWSPAFWYAAGSRYGSALSRYYDAFDAEQLLVLRYDDYENDPNAMLKRVEAHLSLSTLPSYPVDTRYMVSGMPHSRVLHRLLHGTSPLKRAAKRVAPPAVLRALARMRAANLRDPEVLPPDVRERLNRDFAEEIALTAKLSGVEVLQSPR